MLVDKALEDLSVDFRLIYADRWGRPSIPREHLLRAMLLQAFYADEPAWDFAAVLATAA